MLNKVRSFFGGSPKTDKEVNHSSWCYRNRYARNSMERQVTADDDRGSSINSSDNYLIDDNSPRLLRSKSDSSLLLPSNEDSNTRMLGAFRSSLELYDLRGCSDSEDETARDEVQEHVLNADSERRAYDDYEEPNYYSRILRVVRTYDTTTDSMQLQDANVLNFQGNIHALEEIAPYWKKDCRTWLWKSQKLPDRLRKLKQTQLFN